MNPNPSDLPLLNDAHVAALHGPVSVNACSRGADGVPQLTRAIGCRVSPDRRQVSVFVPAYRSGAFLDGVRQQGAVAVVVHNALNQESVQVKGTDAVITPLAPGDAEDAATRCGRFVSTLVDEGYREPFMRALTACPEDELVKVSFTVSAAFWQTPGPDAGESLEK